MAGKIGTGKSWVRLGRGPGFRVWSGERDKESRKRKELGETDTHTHMHAQKKERTEKSERWGKKE